MKKFSTCLFALLLVFSPMLAQGKLMNSMRLKLMEQKESSMQKMVSDQKVEAYIHFNGDVDVAVLEKYNADVHSLFKI